MHIYHVTTRREWIEAERSGRYDRSTRDSSLAEVGFIHCSYEHQVRQIADVVYGDLGEETFVLTIDPTGLPVQEQNGYPHIHSALPCSAVIDVTRLAPAENGLSQI